MMAEIQPPIGDGALGQAHGAERGVTGSVGDFHRAGEFARRQRRNPGGDQCRVDAGGFVGAEHQAIQPLRAAQDFRPPGVTGRRRDQFQVVGAKDRQVVHRPQRVIPARRQRKAEAAIGVFPRVDPVTHIDHDVIESGQRGGRQRGNMYHGRLRSPYRSTLRRGRKEKWRCRGGTAKSGGKRHTVAIGGPLPVSGRLADPIVNQACHHITMPTCGRARIGVAACPDAAMPLHPVPFEERSRPC